MGIASLFHLRPRIKSKNHPLIQYVPGIDLVSDQTVERLSPEMLVGLPEQYIRGPGEIPNGELPLFQPPQVYQNISLPVSPYQGIPVGQLVTQGLISQDQYEILVGLENADGTPTATAQNAS